MKLKVQLNFNKVFFKIIKFFFFKKNWIKIVKRVKSKYFSYKYKLKYFLKYKKIILLNKALINKLKINLKRKLKNISFITKKIIKYIYKYIYFFFFFRFKHLLKKLKKKARLKKITNYWLFLKPTLNNLFAYVIYIPRLKKKKYFLINKYYKFYGISLGMVGYKGPAKNSLIAAEDMGLYFSKKLKKVKILKVNLVLMTRLNKKYKEFLKGLCKYGKIRVKRIFFFPKFAHNGCRLKNKKRK